MFCAFACVCIDLFLLNLVRVLLVAVVVRLGPLVFASLSRSQAPATELVLLVVLDAAHTDGDNVLVAVKRSMVQVDRDTRALPKGGPTKEALGA